jgi:hypothetical protein
MQGEQDGEHQPKMFAMTLLAFGFGFSTGNGIRTPYGSGHTLALGV